MNLIRIAGIGMVFLVACGGRTAQTPPEDVKVTDNKGKEGVITSEVDATTSDEFPQGCLTPTSGKTIKEIQLSEQGTCNPDAVETKADGLKMANIIVVSPKWVSWKDKTTGDPKAYGYYVSDLGFGTTEAWTGTMLQVPVDMDGDFKVGDVLSVSGKHKEYYCMTEIETTKIQVVCHSDTIPKAIKIDPKDVGSQDPAKAEQYEGVMVMVEDVTVVDANPDAPKDYGCFKVTGDLIVCNDFALEYMNKGTDKRKVGDHFAKITGVVKYSFGRYVLMALYDDELTPQVIVPDQAEKPQDVEVIETCGYWSGKKVFDIQSDQPSKNCTNEANTTIIENITLGPVVVTSPMFSMNDKMDGFYVADFPTVGDEEFRGIFVAVYKDKGVKVSVGDVVKVIGDYKEYYCFTEIVADEVTQVCAGQAVDYQTIEKSILCNGGLSNKEITEKYEGVVVTLNDVTVSDPNPGGDKPKYWFVLDCGILVGDDFKPNFIPTKDMKIKSITGAIRYTYGKYLLEPLSKEHIMVDTSGGETSVEKPPESTAEEVVTKDIFEQVVTDQKKIFDIQSQDSSVKCSQSQDIVILKDVKLAPVVVTSPKATLGTTWEAFFVSDFPVGGMAAYSGIAVYVKKEQGITVTPGDVVNIEGNYKEYFCYSEIEATKVEKTGTMDVPPPWIVSENKIFCNGGADSPEKAEEYEGLIVTLNSVTIDDTAPTGTQPKVWFTLECGILIGNDFGVAFTPSKGMKLKSITGAVRYSWNKYLVVPRTIDDIQVEQTGPACPEGAVCKSVQDIQSGSSSTECTNEENTIVTKNLLLSDVVIVSPKCSAGSTLDEYYVAEINPQDKKYSGMLVVLDKAKYPTNFVPSDVVSFFGDYKEYFCLTELVVTKAPEKKGSQPLPQPVILDSKAFENGGDKTQLEPYEGVIVTINDVEITNATGGTKPTYWFTVGSGILIRDECNVSQSFTPIEGQKLKSITGAVSYSYGKYLLVPRSKDDIVID